jgi:hypothetical protein
VTQLPLLPEPPRRDPVAEYVDHWAPLLGRLNTERKAAEAAAYEALEDAEPVPEPRPFQPGDLVRYSPPMMRALGSLLERRFVVAPCSCDLCVLGDHVALGEDRHIAKAGIEHVQLAPHGPVRPADVDAVLEQLGMRVDQDGRWWLRRLCG